MWVWEEKQSICILRCGVDKKETCIICINFFLGTSHQQAFIILLIWDILTKLNLTKLI